MNGCAGLISIENTLDDEVNKIDVFEVNFDIILNWTITSLEQTTKYNLQSEYAMISNENSLCPCFCLNTYMFYAYILNCIWIGMWVHQKTCQKRTHSQNLCYFNSQTNFVVVIVMPEYFFICCDVSSGSQFKALSIVNWMSSYSFISFARYSTNIFVKTIYFER